MGIEKTEETEEWKGGYGKPPVAHRFKPGHPGLRKKGTRNKLGDEFLKALLRDFKEHGISAIAECREKKPEAYVKVIAGLLPKDVKLNINPLADVPEDELIEQFRQLSKELGPLLLAAPGGGGGDTEASVRDEQDSVDVSGDGTVEEEPIPPAS